MFATQFLRDPTWLPGWSVINFAYTGVKNMWLSKSNLIPCILLLSSLYGWFGKCLIFFFFQKKISVSPSSKFYHVQSFKVSSHYSFNFQNTLGHGPLFRVPYCRVLQDLLLRHQDLVTGSLLQSGRALTFQPIWVFTVTARPFAW